MDKVTTDAAFSHRKPLYSFKNSNNNAVEEKPTVTAENVVIKDTVDTGLRRNKPTRRSTDVVTARRPRHASAPDLSFGGKVDMSLLEVNRFDGLKDFNERSLKVPVRRPSLGSELEHIEEGEESISDNESEEDNSIIDRLSISERLLTRPVRLPPIFENQGYKPQRRDFTQRTNGENTIGVSDAIQHRYVRHRMDNRRRKLSM